MCRANVINTFRKSRARVVVSEYKCQKPSELQEAKWMVAGIGWSEVEWNCSGER